MIGDYTYDIQADFGNTVRFLWIVNCETVRYYWTMKISGVTEQVTPRVSQNRPKSLEKKSKSCGRFNVSVNDMKYWMGGAGNNP